MQGMIEMNFWIIVISFVAILETIVSVILTIATNRRLEKDDES